MPGNPDTPPSRLTDPAGVEDFLLYRMARIVAQGGSLVRRFCEGRFGITRREWTTLALLASAPQLSWAELSRRSEIDAARLSRSVSALVTKGLALKTHRPNRQLDIHLTEQGRALYADMFPIARRVNMELMQSLDADTVAMLDRALTELHARGERVALDTPAPNARRPRRRAA